MKYTIQFDICAVILMLILILTLFAKKLIKGRENRTFLLFAFIVFFTSIFSVLTSIAANNKDMFEKGVVENFHFLYLLFRNANAVIYLIYIIALADIWHKISYHKIIAYLLGAPYAVVIALLVANKFNGKIFYLDEAENYIRGEWFLVLYVLASLYMCVGCILLIKYRRQVRSDIRGAMYLLIGFSMAAVVIQYFMPENLVEMLANAVSLLLVVTMVKKPEDYLDDVSGLSKYSAYMYEIGRCFDSGKHVDIIIVDIINYNEIIHSVGLENEKNVIVELANRIKNVESKSSVDIIKYHLDRGRFRTIICGDQRKKTEDYLKEMHKKVSESISYNGTTVSVVAFVCVAAVYEDINSFNEFVKFDSEASSHVSYEKKIYRASELINDEKFMIKSEMDYIIEDALNNNYLEVYYQPIYSIKEKKFNSAEALIRLKSPKYGFIPPNVFIPEAERNGMIHKVGEFVFEEVCKFAASEEFSKLGVNYIEINLSVAQCMHSDLADTVLRIMKKYNVDARTINLEITETAASYDQDVMNKNLELLDKAGIHFSLDDYGTGYSNIQRVASLPLTIIKLDKTFVDTFNDDKMGIILKNTIRMIKEMNMEIVVEGVETKDMLNKFTELECEYIQGYYFSKPLQKSEFIKYIKENNEV